MGKFRRSGIHAGGEVVLLTIRSEISSLREAQKISRAPL